MNSNRTFILTGILALVLILTTACSEGTDRSTPLHQEVPTTMTPTTLHDGESAIYPGTDLDYRDGAWWVDGVEVIGVDCPTEDSCYPMEHDGGWMIHEDTP